MRRPRYVAIGVFIVVAVLAFVAVFGFSVLPGVRAIVWAGLLMLGGSSFVVGGWVESVAVGDREFAWWRFVGLGNALVGLALVFAYLPDLVGADSTARLVLSVVAVVGGSIVFLVGVDTVRGGGYVALE